MHSTSPDSDAPTGGGATADAEAASVRRPAIYFDGVTNRPHAVVLRFGPNLDLVENNAVLASWPYDDLRSADGAPLTLRLKCVSSLREAERNADAFAIETMHALGRSPAPMGELLFRITGAQGGRVAGILASHPLTEDRSALMQREDRPVTGPEILSTAEWQALKSICHSSATK
jgi:hypothetical protein